MQTGTALYNTKEAAAYLGVSVPYLKKARTEGAPGGRTPGPKYIRIGLSGKKPRGIRYPKEELDEWKNSFKRVSKTAEEA